jgi:8-oxo-dGTP pyrophosphatase MutT (NUDIX family)
MLITTRRTKRWTPPKGWPMEGRSLAGAAAQEAWEEAGVKGAISEDAIGVYNYDKPSRGNGYHARVRVEVFPLQVQQIEDKYPERGQRKRKWMSPGAAADAVREPELKRLIANFPA